MKKEKTVEKSAKIFLDFLFVFRITRCYDNLIVW